MSPLELGLLYAVLTFALMFLGLPIAFAMGGVAIVFMLWLMPPVTFTHLAETIYAELDNFTLLTIPLFILMGAAIGKTRAAVDLYESFHRWLYKVPGGLGVANVVGCSVFAAMCGSSPATAAAIGGMGIPQMRARGYPASLAAGLIAAGGTLGILIPPSLTLIIYGVIAEQSIGRLLLAGVGPGIMITILFALYVMYAAQRAKAKARAAGADHVLLHPEHYTWRARLEALPRLLPFLLLIAAVMVSLYGGIATPSEVAGVGALGAVLLVILLYRAYRRADVKAILSGTIRESCMIMLIIAMAFLYTYVMSYLRITQAAAEWLVALEMSRWAFLVWVNVLLLILGCFLPPVAIIIMVTPIIMPGILAHGFDPIWFGIILTINMELGLITPPVGLNLFVINGIAPDIRFGEIVRGILPFILIMILSMVILCFFPQIAIWLPDQSYAKG